MKWTKEKCESLARTCETLKEFRRKYKNAYGASCEKGWIKEFTWLKRRTSFWNSFENCKNEALKCETLKEFRIKYSGAYNASIREGWLKEFTWLKRESKATGFWNSFENCKNEALKCETLKEFRRKHQCAYASSRKNDWIKEFTWLKQEKKKVHRDLEDCKEEALKCKTLKEFREEHPDAYRSSYKKGWLKEFTWLKRKEVIIKRKTWTFEDCKEEALKCETLKEFNEEHSGAYYASCKRGWLKEFTWLKVAKWTYEKCKKEALKCNNLKEFRKNHKNAYSASLRYDWLNEFDWLRREYTRTLDLLEINEDDIKILDKPSLLAIVWLKRLPKDLYDKLKYCPKEEQGKVLKEIKESLKNRKSSEGELTQEEFETKQDLTKTTDLNKRDQEEMKGDQEFQTNVQKFPSFDDVIEELKATSRLEKAGCYETEEVKNFIVNNYKQKLWTALINKNDDEEDKDIIEKAKDSLNTESSAFFQKVMNLFLVEYIGVAEMKTPKDWKFADDKGIKRDPNVMQKLTAYKVKQYGQFGNWSETGTGKTLSALLTSRNIGAKNTLVLIVNSNGKTWKEQITRGFDNCNIYTKNMIGPGTKLPDGNNYILVNYEEFQNVDKLDKKWISFIDLNRIDFVVLDEIQMVKYRNGHKISIRRCVVENLLQEIDKRYGGEDKPGRKVPVLALSATPVINDLSEGYSILNLLTGKEKKKRIYNNTKTAYDLHFGITCNGIRIVGKEPAKTIFTKKKVKAVMPKDIMKYSDLIYFNESKEIILKKLDYCIKQGYLVKGQPTVLYTETVHKDNTVECVIDKLKNQGYSVGEYTGRNTESITTIGDSKDKKLKRDSDLDEFIKGKFDVLVASKPLGTGTDGLQKVCNHLILLTIPWTYAGLHQLVGRFNRQGTNFEEVYVLIPTVEYSDKISVDNNRMARIKDKDSVTDVVMTGNVPENIFSRDQLEKEATNLIIEYQKHRNEITEEEEYVTIEAAELPEHKERKKSSRNYNANICDMIRTHKNLQRLSTDEIAEKMEDDEFFRKYHEGRDSMKDDYLDVIYSNFLTSRKSKVVGDFGCGLNLLKDRAPQHKFISVDWNSIDDPSVIKCDTRDMSEFIEDGEIDIAIHALSLWGKEWRDNFKEDYRVLDNQGRIIIVGSRESTIQTKEEVMEALSSCNFINIDDNFNGLDGISTQQFYVTALKP